MGLAGDIATLEAKEQSGQDVVDELALAYAEMIMRKSSKRLISSWFRNLECVLKKAGRYQELIDANSGVDPGYIGEWDCQAAVESWYDQQSGGKAQESSYLDTLRARFPVLTDDEIVAAALNTYEMHTRPPDA